MASVTLQGLSGGPKRSTPQFPGVGRRYLTTEKGLCRCHSLGVLRWKMTLDCLGRPVSPQEPL